MPRMPTISYSSPIVAHVAGRDQLLISGGKVVASYDPENGKPLWTADATTSATCGTMVWDGGLVFASGGYPDAETAAIAADGSGRVVWRNREKCYEQSMLAVDGYVYAVNDRGIAYCWKADDGTQMWQQRLGGGGAVSSSPILAGGNIYCAQRSRHAVRLQGQPAGLRAGRREPARQRDLRHAHDLRQPDFPPRRRPFFWPAGVSVLPGREVAERKGM